MNIGTVMSIVSGFWVILFGSQTAYQVYQGIRTKTPLKIKPFVPGSLAAGCIILLISIFFTYILNAPPPTPPTGFMVTSIHNGQVIQQSDLPLRIKGTYSSEGSSGSVWAVLVDDRGQYYAQYPQVHLADAEWTASNVQPLTGIVEIDFVFVDQAGATYLQNQGFGAFSTLPDNNRILARVSITSQATHAV